MNQKNNFFKRKTCRLCGSRKVLKVLNVPSSQPVDNFRKYDDDQINLNTFKMDLYQCMKCGHAQLLDIVHPEILYGNYVYKSATSTDLKVHFKNYANYLLSRRYVRSNQKILDVGSNDGLLLDYLKSSKIKTFGIDPAKEVSKIAVQKGHKIFCDFLSLSSVKKLKKMSKSQFDLITANNVFSHSDNLKLTLKCISKLLLKKGVYIFEVSYLLDTLKNRVIDYIYHEHLSYHSIKSLKPFLKSEGFYIYDIIKIPTKGGSVRIVCGKEKLKENINLVSSMIASEVDYGIYNNKIYKTIQNEINFSKKKVNLEIIRFKKKFKDSNIYGYGACATGTVLLKMLEIEKHLSGLIENNQNKIGTLSPNSFLPVLSLNQIKKEKKLLILILAWRFEKEIKEKIQKAIPNKNVKILLIKPKMSNTSLNY